MSIQTDTSDKPSGKILTEQSSTGTPSNGFVFFAYPANLTANTKYWFVVQVTCYVSCSETPKAEPVVYRSDAHSYPIDFGGTNLHYETLVGSNWTTPAIEGDLGFILAGTDFPVNVYNTTTLYNEIVADDAQSTASTPPVGWQSFLNHEQAQINYNLTQMLTAYSGRPFVWLSGIPFDVETLPNFNASYFVTQATGAGGPFLCSPSDPSCGGTHDYWAGDADGKVSAILSSPNQDNVLGWSSFGALSDNAGGVTPEDLSQQYLIELPQLATNPLTFNDWCWGLGCHGLNNFTQTAPMRSFGTLLNRMSYTGGYYGTSAATAKVLWIASPDDSNFPSYLTSAAYITETSWSNSNLTQFGNLRQFNVIVDPGIIQSITPSAESRIIAFVKSGGGVLEVRTPAAWEYNIMGLAPSSGCCSSPFSILPGNKITAPYTSLPGYAPYYAASFVKEGNESVTFEVQDAGGRAVISSNEYFSGSGVYLPQPYARLQYSDGGTGAIGDSYVSLVINGLFYASHHEDLLPIAWQTTYSQQQPWVQLTYTVDGSVGHPLLWVSSNSSSNQLFDTHLNATFYGITGSWKAIDVQNMSVIASGSGTDIHIRTMIKAFDWEPIYIVAVPSNLNVVYTTATVKVSTVAGTTGTYVVSGVHNASSWIVIESASAIASVSSNMTGTIPPTVPVRAQSNEDWHVLHLNSYVAIFRTV